MPNTKQIEEKDQQITIPRTIIIIIIIKHIGRKEKFLSSDASLSIKYRWLCISSADQLLGKQYKNGRRNFKKYGLEPFS